jgi:hypothetical protein
LFGGRNSGDRSQKLEVRSQESEFRSQKIEAAPGS